MTRRAHRNAFAAVLALSAAALLPAAASADTVTIGSTLSHPNTPALCFGLRRRPGGRVERALELLPFTSPANGVVTGWSVRSGDTGAVYGLRVLHPNGGTSYTSTQASALAPAIGSATDATYHFDTSLPIQQGDAIGISTETAG